MGLIYVFQLLSKQNQVQIFFATIINFIFCFTAPKLGVKIFGEQFFIVQYLPLFLLFICFVWSVCAGLINYLGHTEGFRGF